MKLKVRLKVNNLKKDIARNEIKTFADIDDIFQSSFHCRAILKLLTNVLITSASGIFSNKILRNEIRENHSLCARGSGRTDPWSHLDVAYLRDHDLRCRSWHPWPFLLWRAIAPEEWEEGRLSILKSMKTETCISSCYKHLKPIGHATALQFYFFSKETLLLA